LIPRPAESQTREIHKDRQRSTRFDNEPAKTIADSLSGKFRENLMRAVEHRSAHSIEEPHRDRLISIHALELAVCLAGSPAFLSADS
jgi:hypothetical protein